MFHRSARADVRRTWHHVGWRGSVPTPLPARPSLLRAYPPLRSGRRSSDMLSGCPQRLRPYATTRSSLAPACIPPLRSGRRSSDSLRGPSTHSARTAAGGLPALSPSRLGVYHHSVRGDVRIWLCYVCGPSSALNPVTTGWPTTAGRSRSPVSNRAVFMPSSRAASRFAIDVSTYKQCA